MPLRRWDIRIRDMLTFIIKIQEYTKGMDFKEFSGDPKTLDAVVRNLEIHGEAARHIPVEILDKHPDIQ